MLILLLLALLLPGYALAADNPLLRQSDGSDVRQGGVGDRAKTSTTLDSTLAGERLQESATSSYLAVRNEANVSIISKTTAVTIGGGVANDTHLLGLHITAALTGTCVITGFADSDGAAQSYTLPAATTAGYKDFLAARAVIADGRCGQHDARGARQAREGFAKVAGGVDAA